jgi:DNA-binding NtrC family response regulator
MGTGPFRVLCIDDEPRITRALKALFRDIEVFVTNDPRSGAALAREHDVDVVICDQRMPELPGVECLREIRATQPRALRILLTGFSDLRAVLASVNEGEVYRFVNKPWDNTELRDLVIGAARIAREAPVLTQDLLGQAEHAQARDQVGVLVLEDDAAVQQRLREILAPHYQVRFANSIERALQVLEQHETGVVISETEVAQGDLTALVKALKLYHPAIATIVVTDRANSQLAIDLINEGQVYRMLLKPVRMGSCRLSVDAAIARYWQLKQQPAAIRRYANTERIGNVVPLTLNQILLDRIRQLPQRIARITRFA